MSGDNLHGKQKPIFYSEEVTESKKQLIRTHYKTNYVLELESMFVNARYRNGSPMQE